jgi:hypothetical protein
MNTPIKIALVAAVSMLFGSGCLAQAYDPAVDGDWDQFEAALNEDFANVELGDPSKPDPTPWVADGDPNKPDPTPWVADGDPNKPDPTPWVVDGDPDKPDPTPWRSLRQEPNKLDSTPWAPDAEEAEDTSSFYRISSRARSAPQRYAVR